MQSSYNGFKWLELIKRKETFSFDADWAHTLNEFFAKIPQISQIVKIPTGIYVSHIFKSEEQKCLWSSLTNGNVEETRHLTRLVRICSHLPEQFGFWSGRELKTRFGQENYHIFPGARYCNAPWHKSFMGAKCTKRKSVFAQMAYVTSKKFLPTLIQISFDSINAFELNSGVSYWRRF